MSRRILAGDALEVLYPTLDDGSVHLVSVDVPYNLDTSALVIDAFGSNTASAKAKSTHGGKAVMGGGCYDVAPYDFRPHLNEWLRVLTPGGHAVIWCSDVQFSQIIAVAKADPRTTDAYFLAWHVTNPAPTLRRARPLSGVQIAIVVRRDGAKSKFNWMGMHREGHNFLEGPTAPPSARLRCPGAPDGEDRLSGEKPVWLAEWVATRYGTPGALCIDPHSGTGALLAGASRCGMSVLGSEIRPWWADRANARVSAVADSSIVARFAEPGAGAPVGPPPRPTVVDMTHRKKR